MNSTQPIEQPYDFDIQTLFKDAWSFVHGFKLPLWLGWGIIYLIYFIIGVAVFLLIGLPAIAVYNIPSENLQSYSDYVHAALDIFLLPPMLAGLMMLGIRRIVNLHIDGRQVFNYFRFWGRTVGVSAIQWVLTAIIAFTAAFDLGLLLIIFGVDTMHSITILSIIVGVVATALSVISIYLILGYMFALPLIVEKNLSVWQALETSRKQVTRHWFKIFFTSILIMLITILSAIPLGIGLIWSVPWAHLTYATLYKTLFGITIQQ